MGVENVVFKSVGVDYTNKPEAAHRHQERAFRRARESIRIVETRTPEMGGLEEAVKRGCFVEVVVGPRLDAYSLWSLTKLGVAVHELEQPPTQRFAVIDGRHIILHKQTEQYILHNDKDAPEFSDRFVFLKRQARAVY